MYIYYVHIFIVYNMDIFCMYFLYESDIPISQLLSHDVLPSTFPIAIN